MTAWIFKVKGNNKPFILDFLQLYCKLHSVSHIFPLFLANSREYFIPVNTYLPRLRILMWVSMFWEQWWKYNTGDCSADHCRLGSMMSRGGKIDNKRDSASQPGFWFKTKENSIQEWWINDKWNIVSWGIFRQRDRIRGARDQSEIWN